MKVGLVISMTNTIGMNSNVCFKGRMSQESQILKEKLENIGDKQGFLGKAWNDIKEVTTLGVSQSDCESMLEKYNNGEISFEEAVSYLDEFDSKQETMSSLFSNILTGIGAIAIAGAGPVGWGLAFAKGAPIGAALKTGIGILDRATNNIEDDEIDAKKIVKDVISGTFTGAASAVSSSQCFIYKGLGFDKTLADGIGKSMVAGALCGVECGAMSGSASYMTDVAFGDKEFNFGDLANNALTSAFVSGTVGGAVGAGTFGLKDAGILKQDGSVAQYSFLSSSRKVGGQIEREALDL